MLSACFSLDTGPGVLTQQSVITEGEALDEFSVARGLTGGLIVSGQIVGRLRCDLVKGEVDERDDDVFITVRLIADRSACLGAVPTTWSYVVNVINIDPGQWGVRVDYKYQGFEGIEGVRLDTVVTVGG